MLKLLYIKIKICLDSHINYLKYSELCDTKINEKKEH